MRASPAAFTLTYVVFDERSLDAVFIDSELDYETCSTEELIGAAASLERRGTAARLRG